MLCSANPIGILLLGEHLDIHSCTYVYTSKVTLPHSLHEIVLPQFSSFAGKQGYINCPCIGVIENPVVHYGKKQGNKAAVYRVCKESSNGTE